MTDKSKKIFLFGTIIGSFVIYSVIYYAGVFKNAPYKFTEFKSIVFKYGPGDSLVNSYNSLTGEYDYINKRDSLVKTHLNLTTNDLLYLHRKAADLGFWDFPSVDMGDTTIKHNGMRPPRYLIEFNYQRKSKKVLYDASFDGDPRLKDANEQLIKEITKVLVDAEGRQSN